MHSQEDTSLADGSFLALSLRPGGGFPREEMKEAGVGAGSHEKHGERGGR